MYMQYFIDLILSRHARKLLLACKLQDLGRFAAHLNFNLAAWLSRERFDYDEKQTVSYVYTHTHNITTGLTYYGVVSLLDIEQLALMNMYPHCVNCILNFRCHFQVGKRKDNYLHV